MAEFDDELFLALSVDDLKEIDEAEKLSIAKSAAHAEAEKELVLKQGENRILRSRMQHIEAENQRLKSDISALKQSYDKERERLRLSLSDEIERVKTSRMFLAKSSHQRLPAKSAHSLPLDPGPDGTKALGLSRSPAENGSTLLYISNEGQLLLTNALKDHISSSALDGRDAFIGLLGDFVSLMYPRSEFTLLKYFMFLEKWTPEAPLPMGASSSHYVLWLTLFANEILASNLHCLSQHVIHDSPLLLEGLSQTHWTHYLCSLFVSLLFQEERLASALPASATEPKSSHSHCRSASASSSDSDGDNATSSESKSKDESGHHLYALLDHLRHIYALLHKRHSPPFAKLADPRLVDKLFQISPRHLALYFDLLALLAPDFYTHVAAIAVAFHGSLAPRLSAHAKAIVFPVYVELLILLCSLQ